MKITDKLLYADNIKIYDFIGNAVEVSAESLGLMKCIFAAAVENEITLPLEKLEYGKISMIINHECRLLFNEVEEILLSNMQIIEILFFQYLIKRKINEEDYELWTDYLIIKESVKNGRIDCSQYEIEISRLRNKDEVVFNAIQSLNNLEFSNQLILDEFRHGEFRLIDCINSQIQNLRQFTAKQNIEPNREVITFSIHSDNAGFCIQDFIKSVYKSLDILCKIMFYTNNLDEIPKKIPSQYFDNIIKVINSWKEGKEKTYSLNLIEHLKIFTLIRNEITHNTSFHTIRQPVFVGNATECINSIPLIYSDIMFWDYTGNKLDRASGQVGFYKNKKNALSEMSEHFISAIKLSHYCLKHLYNDLINKLLGCDITSVYIWKTISGIDSLVEADTLNLIKHFSEITFE